MGRLHLALGAWLLAASAAPAPQAAGALEARAGRQVRLEFERVGRRVPVQDAALGEAARALALQVLAGGTAQVADLVRLTRAVSDAGGWDASPRAYAVRAGAEREVLETLEGRSDLPAEPATHLGVGAVAAGGRHALVVLLSERKAALAPFPRLLSHPGDSERALCGRLEAPLGAPEVFVTQPDGHVERVAAAPAPQGGFCARLPFPAAGEYTLEVLGRSERGPEVAALFHVDVGGAPRAAQGEGTHGAEPTGVPEARSRLLVRINALRQAHGAPPLAPDAVLDGVAQAYSERMAREGFFAHVDPGGGDLRSRLRAAGAAYQQAGENIGLASGPLAAHFGIEHSPGHRQNLLAPHYTHVGLGVAFQHVEGRPQALVTEVFTAAAAVSSDPLADAYQALAAHRTRRGLPRLERSAPLEALALEHARQAVRLDQPRADLPGRPLHERVFEALPQASRTSVDVVVTEEPSLLPDSRSLADASNRLVGVGLVRADSPTFGPGRVWVVVIYAATPPEQVPAPR